MLTETEEFILQERENKPHISNPGLITTFGGVCESGESFEQCITREIVEELNFALQEDQIKTFAEFPKVESDGHLTLCKFFYYSAKVDPQVLQLLEGEQIVLLPMDQVDSVSTMLSPMCIQVLEEFKDWKAQ